MVARGLSAVLATPDLPLEAAPASRPAGFWVAPGDGTRTLGDLVVRGHALAAGCGLRAYATMAGR